MPHEVRPRGVVIGASAGGVEPLARLVSSFPRSFPAAIFVVVHLPEASSSRLPRILAGRGALPASFAVDGASIAPGTISVAPPGRHLVLEDGAMRVRAGPKENGTRPAIDPLFRSAAKEFGAGAIGVLLSGSLDDGSLGLAAIKEAGGVAIVQDPDEALFPWLPRNAMETVEVDAVLPIDQIGPQVVRRVDGVGRRRVSLAAQEPVPPVVVEGGQEEMERLGDEGSVSELTCPACGGAIWEVEEAGARVYRCHVGHAFGPGSFQIEQARAVEAALWAAVRALEEKAALMQRMSDEAREGRRKRIATVFADRSAKGRRQADAVRDVALSLATAEAVEGEDEVAEDEVGPRSA